MSVAPARRLKSTPSPFLFSLLSPFAHRTARSRRLLMQRGNFEKWPPAADDSEFRARRRLAIRAERVRALRNRCAFAQKRRRISRNSERYADPSIDGGRLYINQRKDEKRRNLNIQPVGSAVPLLPQRLPLAGENGRRRGKKFHRLSRNVTFARVLTDSI